MGHLIFDYKSIYEISKLFFFFVADGQAQSNLPLQLFQTLGALLN